MLRLLLSLLLVSLVLALENSTDDRINIKNNVKPDSALNYNIRPRRIQQKPYVEIREHNVGRYFRRRPQATTVSSIFSMKVENESQHVYPNMRPLDNLHVQPNQEKINITDITTSTKQQKFPPTANFNNRRPSNIQKRIRYTRTRRPSFAQTPALINQQAEEISEQAVTSTTTTPIVDIAVKGQEKVVLPTDSKFSNKVSSLKRPHPTISQIMETFIQRRKEKGQKVVMAATNTPVVISSTEKEPEKHLFTPSDAYVSNPMLNNIHIQAKQEKINMTDTSTSTQLQNSPSITNFNNRHPNNIRKTIRYTRPRRPSSTQTPALINQQTEKMMEPVVTSTTAGPIVDIAVTKPEKVVLSSSEPKIANEDISSERLHANISQIPETFIHRMKEITETNITSKSNVPVVISTTEKELEKGVFTPSDAYVSNLMLDNLYDQPKHEEINMTDTSISKQQRNFPPTTDYSNQRSNSIQKRVRYNKPRSSSFDQTPALINQQTEKITEQVFTSTTTAPIVDTAVKGQEKVMSPTSDTKFLIKVSSLERPHPTISQIMEAFIQRKKATAQKVVMSTSNAPVVISSTEKEPEKLVLTPSDAYVSNSMLDNIHVQPKQEKINVTDLNISMQLQKFPSIINLTNNIQYPINIRKTIRYTRRRRPSSTQKPALINQQTKKLTEEVVTSTIAAPIVDISVKEQEKVVLHTSDSKVSNEVSSLEMPHPTISQIPEALIEKFKETSEEVVTSRSNAPVLISTAENEGEKRVFTPSATYISNLISFVKSQRPTFVPKSVLPVNRQKEAIEQAIDSGITTPTAVTAAVPREKIGLFPTTSYVSDKISIARPKFRQLHNRGSYKYNMNDVNKDQSYVQESKESKTPVLDSNSSHVSSTTPSTPPPGPTLSPWYDGFGK